MKYAVVMEQSKDGSWGAYPIDFWGVIITEDTIPAALESVNTGIEMLLECKSEDGSEAPASITAPAHSVEGLDYVSGYTYFDEMPYEWKAEARQPLPEDLRRLLAD